MVISFVLIRPRAIPWEKMYVPKGFVDLFAALHKVERGAGYVITGLRTRDKDCGWSDAELVERQRQVIFLNEEHVAPW